MGFDFKALDGAAFDDVTGRGKAPKLPPVSVSMVRWARAPRFQISMARDVFDAIGAGPLWVRWSAEHAVYQLEPHERGSKPMVLKKGAGRAMLRIPFEPGELHVHEGRHEPEYYLDATKRRLFVKVPPLFLSAPKAVAPVARPVPQHAVAVPTAAAGVKDASALLPAKPLERLQGISFTRTEIAILKPFMATGETRRDSLLYSLGVDGDQFEKMRKGLNEKLSDLDSGPICVEPASVTHFRLMGWKVYLTLVAEGR